MTKVVANGSNVINRYEVLSDVIDLSPFKDVAYVPQSISLTTYGNYENLTFDTTDMTDWGMAVMGPYDRPSFSADAIVIAVLDALQAVDVPHPVYAVFDKDTDGWYVGYNSEDAFWVTFSTDGDLVKYNFKPATFSKDCILSENNILRSK